ncbi:uncharacterized protein B0I36DRAFT_84323 [Microdochium trichocladiopsis]|uniref:Rho-GAP domain-containing protein n=1 Tax=Microdochium trichocladiopsis TaxID=1682393 RepID=A0A9P8Y8B0_9PEZI|nr:uncharacterized protein B0I36DRAFT_84323 [Microdochium trichocladiopsis]KAH7034804.1 hypothetical protein B0I36DRAFT_84323 [Microdochium trichocladiopsis]
MGRKQAPQPLSLSEPSPEETAALAAAISAAADPASVAKTSPYSPYSSSPGIATSQDSSSVVPSRAPGGRSPQPGVHNSDVASAHHILPISSSNSASPKSPRSPFSRFNTSRKPQGPSELHSRPSHQTLGSSSRQQSSDDLQLAQRPKAVSETRPPKTSQGSRGDHPPTAFHNNKHHTDDEKHTRSVSASRFFNFSKSKSSSQLPQHGARETIPEGSSRTVEAQQSRSEKGRVLQKQNIKQSADTHTNTPSPGPDLEPLARSQSDLTQTISATEGDSQDPRRNKQKQFNLLARTRSIKDRDAPEGRSLTANNMPESDERSQGYSNQQPLKTAPMNPDGPERSFRGMMNSSTRNQSADRAVAREAPPPRENRHDRDHSRAMPSSYRDNGGSTFFGGLKSSGTRAVGMVSRNIFGKSSRSGSTTEKEHVVDDEHYIIKVLNKPLIEQTRITRISKRLEDSRDKTEFWMPAFPWRAIDYLNFKGCEVEGLYRVPGSGPQIKKWQRRFDEEHDVDLFKQEDLYDINIIGSMLKAWLRELPDELFPKEAQERVSRQCEATEEVPQMLIDELSDLPPFNYYLLFAITCHLSLLLGHSDKNKMDFRNLCICFQPCMKIDAFCFRYLVCNWRQCWQGCKHEAKYIEEEYRLFEQPPPVVTDGRSQTYLTVEDHSNDRDEASSAYASAYEERNISSSDSSKPGSANGKLRKPQPSSTGQSNGSSSSAAANLSINSERSTRTKEEPRGGLRPLSPIKPLSPLDFGEST